jgi:hypothetical protein
MRLAEVAAGFALPDEGSLTTSALVAWGAWVAGRSREPGKGSGWILVPLVGLPLALAMIVFVVSR